MMPYQVSRWRWPFQASVATRSPSLIAVALEPLGDLQGAPANRAIVGAVNRPLDEARDHLAMRMLDRGEVDDFVNEQRPILHQA